MNPRAFGTSGLHVSPVTFGAMRITPDDDGASSVLLHALERGVTAIDTARNYGESEAIVGRTLRQWRGPRPLIATKVKPLDTSNWRFHVPIEAQFTPASIVASVDASLETLGVERIDYLQLHQWYYSWSHAPDWLETMHRLQAHGKIGHFGVSAQDHEHDGVLKVVDDRMVDGVQIVLNAFESRPLVSVVPLALTRGVGVVARSVFDHSGGLAGAATRETLARDVKLSAASPEIVTEYLSRIDRLRQEARAHGLSLAALSVRFALSHPGVSTLAISMTTTAQVDEAIAAAAEGPLPDDLFARVCRDHVWVKNFYYFSRATVDGLPSTAPPPPA